MPDVAAALKFQKKMIGIESVYINQIDEYRRETRRSLLEIIDRSGVSRSAVTAMQREIDTLAKAVANLSGAASGEVKNTVGNYTTKQLQDVKKVGLIETVNIAPIVAQAAPVAKDLTESIMANQSAWVSQLQTSLQVQAAKLRVAQATPAEISSRLLSDKVVDGRSSVWSVSGNASHLEEVANLWSLGGALVTEYLGLFNESQPEKEYSRQVIATIDERTTNCCLEAHGQIVGMDEEFHLTGTPRYADDLLDVPFHLWCRSTVVLYVPEFEEIGIPTSQMEDAASAELTAREDGSRVKIYPSHATARRP